MLFKKGHQAGCLNIFIGLVHDPVQVAEKPNLTDFGSGLQTGLGDL